MKKEEKEGNRIVWLIEKKVVHLQADYYQPGPYGSLCMNR